MSIAKQWESEQCNSRDCPEVNGRDVDCMVCETLRRDGFRAGVKWVYTMFEANLQKPDPPFNVHEEVVKELVGS